MELKNGKHKRDFICSFKIHVKYIDFVFKKLLSRKANTPVNPRLHFCAGKELMKLQCMVK